MNPRFSFLFVCLLAACATLPEVKHESHKFPKDAFMGKPSRPYKAMGSVRSRVNYVTMDPSSEEVSLCRNYFNKAVSDLVRIAKSKGADAVIDVKSIVFYENGQSEIFAKPECSDDGAEGQSLAQGVAVKWEAKD
jgi:uncharacterized protein YbjQ (UPF0145 family)